MVMRLSARVWRLEKASAIASRSGPCRACGGGRGPVRCHVETHSGEPSDRSKDFCAACGRRLVFYVEFDRAG
ncbi:MAG: hypothetical protein KIS87_08675 [Phycisphaeraceae bacterium]|nr:hypothetical protein [Phycisphaeraceae bacterium]